MYATGQVSSFCDRIHSVTENLAEGDGSQLVFTGLSISKPIIYVESLKIRYTVGATVYYATTDTSGVISGTYISSGSVNEAGEISLTFSTAPDDDTFIIAYEYKTKGLATKLLELVCGEQYEETVGTGDGSTVDFSKTLANTPISYGQCRIRFRISGTDYEVWDDGEGNFVHSLIDQDNSSFDRTTGDIILKFNQPIANTYVIKALYCVGSDGEDWIKLLKRNSKNASGADAFSGKLEQEFILKNSGVSYKEFICIGLREYEYVAGGAYNWNLNLYDKFDTLYEAATSPWNANYTFYHNTLGNYDNTWNNWSGLPSVYLRDDLMQYWICSSKRRIIVIVKVSNSVYASAYLGGARRLASPSLYRNPNIVVGNWVGNYTYASTQQISICQHVSGYLTPCPFLAINNNNLGIYYGTSGHLWVPCYDKADSNYQLAKTGNDKIILFPVYLYADRGLGDLYRICYFEMDGLYFAPSKDIASQDVIQIDGDDYFIFQNNHRVTQLDYMAIKLE